MVGGGTGERGKEEERKGRVRKEVGGGRREAIGISDCEEDKEEVKERHMTEKEEQDDVE